MAKRTLWALLLATLGCVAMPGRLAASECHPPEELRPLADECEKNSVWGEAAVLCLQQFQAQVRAQSGKLGATFGGATAKLGPAQKQSLLTTQADYQASITALRALIASGKQRRTEADAYEDELIFPEDFESVVESGGDVDAFLAHTSCYQKHFVALELVKRDFTRKLQELETALAAAKKAGQAAQTSGNGLNQSAGQADRLKTTYGQGTGGAARGQSGIPASDVTGVRQDQQKQQPLP